MGDRRTTASVPVLIASDLDHTLVFSPRATADLGGALPAHAVETVDGRIIGEMADVVADRLRAFPAHVTFVPATTRTREQLARIMLPLTPRFVIAASGGLVLEHGQPDLHWTAAIRGRLAGVAPAAHVRRALDVLVASGSLLRAYTAEDMFCYALVRPGAMLAGTLACLERTVAQLGWRVVLLGRKLYALPRALAKSDAVAYVSERIRSETGWPPRLLAAGDSQLDWPMLTSADRGWVPGGSELHSLGLRAAHVVVTPSVGHEAAATITAAWTAEIRGGAALAHPNRQ